MYQILGLADRWHIFKHDDGKCITWLPAKIVLESRAFKTESLTREIDIKHCSGNVSLSDLAWNGPVLNKALRKVLWSEKLLCTAEKLMVPERNILEDEVALFRAISCECRIRTIKHSDSSKVRGNQVLLAKYSPPAMKRAIQKRKNFTRCAKSRKDCLFIHTRGKPGARI